jgi:AcrR family transcriptional regulator
MARWEPDAESRLTKAALELFDKQGYDATTIAEIAAAAGLTKRTFFRYFTDKREVLFRGSGELTDRWVAGVRAAQADVPALAAVGAGFPDVAALFTERHAFARTRARVVAANRELKERELSKLQFLTEALTSALVERGVPDSAAALAASTGVTVFHVAFAHWVEQDDPAALGRLLDESLDELRALVAP